MKSRIRFDLGKIRKVAAKYPMHDDKIVEAIGKRVRSAGWMSKEDFFAVCRWKSPRTIRWCEANSGDLVRDVTRIALSTGNEELRISVLTLLSGVSWPTASVILHLCHADPYPILDFRALWSLRIPVPKQYDFDFWWGYTECCRELAKTANVSMRTLDRALWQYSKEKQP